MLIIKNWGNYYLRNETYIFVSGSTVERSAKFRRLRMLCGDAVGSTAVLEPVLARHYVWRVLAWSLITNKCVIDY